MRACACACARVSVSINAASIIQSICPGFLASVKIIIRFNCIKGVSTALIARFSIELLEVRASIANGGAMNVRALLAFGHCGERIRIYINNRRGIFLGGFAPGTKIASVVARISHW